MLPIHWPFLTLTWAHFIALEAGKEGNTGSEAHTFLSHCLNYENNDLSQLHSFSFAPMHALLSCMTALSFACLNGTQCHNELKGLLILNLITLVCPSAAFTLIAFLWFSTFCFLINHLLIRALLFYTCPCHSSLKSCPFTKLLHRLNLFFLQSCSHDSWLQYLLSSHQCPLR